MRRRLVWIAVIVIALVICAFLFSPLLARFDAAQVARHDEPVFCWSRWVALIPLPVTRAFQRGLLDGGTQFYDGFGYHLTAKHRIAPLNYAEGEHAQFDSGVIVSFYLPWYERFDFETSIRESE